MVMGTLPLKILIAAAALAAGLLGIGTPMAHADASQAAYVHALQAEGIGLDDTSDRLLQNGYLMCTLLADEDLSTVVSQTAPRMSLSLVQTAYQVGAAIRWLCPEQTWQIQELHDADQSTPMVPAAIAGYGA
jgi:hypothetical protein